jgi:hypothetical protein
MPFAVSRLGNKVHILLKKDASHHPGIATAHARQWIRDANAPVVIDFAQMPLLNSILIGWLFGLMREAKVSSVMVMNAEPTVLNQLKHAGVPIQPYVPTPPPA